MHDSTFKRSDLLRKRSNRVSVFFFLSSSSLLFISRLQMLLLLPLAFVVGILGSPPSPVTYFERGTLELPRPKPLHPPMPRRVCNSFKLRY
jgi:hypothetical protein